jgi:hypothetical protein
MATRISAIQGGGGGGGADIPEEAFSVTGDCPYRFAGKGWTWFFDDYANRITTKDVSDLQYMFYKSSIEHIPFDINLSNKVSDIMFVFADNTVIETAPLIKGTLTPPTSNYSNNTRVSDLFRGCYCLRTIDENYFDYFGGEDFWQAARNYNAARCNMFYECHSLRKLPILKNLANAHTSTSALYKGLAYACYALDEITELPVCETATLNSNTMSSAFSYCGRIQNFTFETNDDGTAKTVKWKAQTLDLSSYVGYINSSSSITTHYNSGITADKEVKDDATYQALKNDPDWFTVKVEYSRYNHDSAVETINSLPDSSAYGTNTIKFKKASGSATDGGAIENLTEAEIAIAAAKGWTVTLS